MTRRLAVLALAFFLGGAAFSQDRGGQIVSDLRPAPLPPPGPPRPLKAIAADRLEIAERMGEYYLDLILSPPTSADVKDPAASAKRQAELNEQLMTWRGHAADAKLEMAVTPAERIAVLHGYHEALKRSEAVYKDLATGPISGLSPLDVDRIAFRRLQIEARLAQEQLEATPPSGRK